MSAGATGGSSGDREHFEAVVVGCGPGGAAAAARLADHGIETLVLERGTEAGSKNVSGGLVYAEESAPYTLDNLFEGFREAAAERPVTDYRIHNVAGDSVKTYDLTDLHEHDTEWCDAVLRRRMDSWLEAQVHEKASETGGGVLTDVRVNGLLREGGEIIGVTCDELDPIEADLIVAADGVNSELARDAGLMDWEVPEEWFQGVKAVVDMEPDVIDDRFDLEPDEGVAHLFSGDLFEGVRGGGFLYTNENSLSIGTVFHLDSLVEERAEPHQLLDALLTHPMMATWIGDDYDEREYAAKLVPDSKKVAHPEPYQDRLVLVGDAAGQMQAQGPIIKGMNHAVTAGALAADAFAVTRGNADPEAAGRRYARMLEESGTMDKLRPRRYELSRTVGERDAVTNAVERVLDSPVGRLALGNPLSNRVLERAYNSPFLVSMLPDTRTGYVTVPTIIGETQGRTIYWDNEVEPPTLEERIGDLTYDTDVGNPHIDLEDESSEASGAAVYACPVSAEDFGGGCYRSEEVKRNGTAETVVSLDTQPCVECGTCAVVADTT
ncbi:FAD-dependent monooxygenase [Natrarchaeobaculum sulfurireducens]|uniref:Electron transfer flavoprotein-quinone oxidoreductase FixC n=1 Tax=Natrarchaeobaculum sulfurireducens TaxID=2044521 RepID=A0A346PR86_9EURY|nr:FAD-dependent monooxygenase [Natrarchaeobaculum sulfurireducens]AXR82031.1 Electron transfer flavoprotein-quinone oxidoreductase FixC [Natrarchaeobaculum sulfurireducens]